MERLPVIAAESCDGCGACCLHMATPPYIPGDELDTLKANAPHVYADFQAVRETRRMQFTANGNDHVPCGFFDWVTRKCRHYVYRPDVCRDFDLGGEDCVAARKRAGVKAQ